MSSPPKSKAPPRSLLADMWNLPNVLTMGRVAVIPVVLFLLAERTAVSSFWAAIVFTLAAITDFLDGYLARKRGLISVFGKFLDPLADKLLVAAVLILLVELGRVPTWVTIVVIARELTITALRTIAMGEGVVMAASQGGKEKTAFQLVAMILLVAHYEYPLAFGFATYTVDFHDIGLVLLYASVVLALVSAGEYFKMFVDAVEAKEKRLANDQR